MVKRCDKEEERNYTNENTEKRKVVRAEVQ